MTIYTKTTWTTGDVITAVKINNLETQYACLLSLSEPFTGAAIYRYNNTGSLGLYGGELSPGAGSILAVRGSDRAGLAATVSLYVPNAAKSADLEVFRATGLTDTPALSLCSRKIIDLATPTAAQDAATKAYVDATAFKSGMVLFWDDAISAIPGGWLFCNGSNGTRDLRGAFIVGADADTGGSYNVGDTGGSATHTLTVDEIPSHLHDIHLISGTNLDSAATYDFTSGAGDSVGDTCYTGGGSAHENRPPFVALPYIRKS